jgi:hypothetical protein
MTVGTLSLVPKALNGFSLKVNWTTGKLPVVYSRNRDTGVGRAGFSNENFSQKN